MRTDYFGIMEKIANGFINYYLNPKFNLLIIFYKSNFHIIKLSNILQTNYHPQNELMHIIKLHSYRPLKLTLPSLPILPHT